MRKLFTLLTLLVCLCTGAWGNQTELISGVTLPDVPSNTLDLSTQTEYEPDENGWIVEKSPKVNIGSKEWHSKLATDGGTADWTVPDGCTAPFVSSTNKSFSRYTVRSGERTHAIRFTGAETASFLVSRNSDTRKTVVVVYSYVGTEQTPIASKSLTSGSIGELLFDELTASTNYIAYIYGTDASNNSDWYEFALKAPAAKVPTSEILKSSAAVKVGSTTMTKDAATNGYSVDGTTITLSNDNSVSSAPTNVKLVKTITYDDASTNEEDVNVTFDGTITDGYFIGTASIGLTGSVTNYTVKVKKDLTPTAVLTSTSGTIAMTNSYTVVGSTTVTLTGGNLTDGTYDVTADDEGTSISPSTFTVADGAVNQEFTITTTASSAATTVFTFGTSAMGADAPTYTLTYSQSSAKRSVVQTDVTGSTTWDWTKIGTASIELKNDGSTIPANGEEFLLAELPEITNNTDFNSQALKVSCQWPNRGDSYYFQGNHIKFNVTVPGTVQVWFSNTSNRTDTPTNRRFLYVNGKNSGVYTLNQTFTNTEAMFVPKGEVVINAFTGDDTPASTMVRINKIVFTPATSIPASIGSYGYASFSTTVPVDFTSVDNAEAYIATGKNEDNITMQKVTGKIAANTGLILKSTNGGEADVIIPVTDETGTYYNTQTDPKNYLFAINSNYNLSAATDGETNYVLSVQTIGNADKVVFAPIGDVAAPVKAGQAGLWLPASTGLAHALTMSFGEDVTGISTVKANKPQAGKVYYNLQGQRVSVPKQGIYVVDGMKVFVE